LLVLVAKVVEYRFVGFGLVFEQFAVVVVEAVEQILKGAL